MTHAAGDGDTEPVEALFPPTPQEAKVSPSQTDLSLGGDQAPAVTEVTGDGSVRLRLRSLYLGDKLVIPYEDDDLDKDTGETRAPLTVTTTYASYPAEEVAAIQSAAAVANLPLDFEPVVDETEEDSK